MKKLNTLISSGQLQPALSHALATLRDDPLNAQMRAVYVELLCIAGELDKADAQLDMIVRQHPDFLLGAVNVRQLIRAETARRDFYQGGMTATLFGEPTLMFSALLKLRLAMHEHDIAAATMAAEEMEQLRPQVAIAHLDQCHSDIRDLDDSLAGYLELFGTDGKYYLAGFEQIASLKLHPVKSLLDLIWRRVDISIIDGPQGEAFLPLIYVSTPLMASGAEAAADPVIQLGRATDWHEHSARLITGTGQKMLLLGEQAVALGDIHQLSTEGETEAVVSTAMAE
ncbi:MULTISPECIES: type VI secretion system accessory protein TagJ [unclassified Arsukibacterium]|uniref:type VI secretion system accessory protein TagJ n=1 Tax=unclassified Arsukibacterium TaxID=2635278 RepID=UPI000C542EC4|nr:MULTISPECIES: type VI secretion system accessory protein TagJ [unclassified Arsukibacterium]MAA93542.1 virulence protein SciE type [Rheinheimera sp.]MBM33494.1 virulence protein SciE type [Rheinheimera sp.]HAW91777.1 virulence protein SciE type [Candidatus Azambacteria bacterium]|tara:strand:- start:17008 stop:17859 length:852 start_codon:yes stop_codon:yes gene_type:complete